MSQYRRIVGGTGEFNELEVNDDGSLVPRDWAIDVGLGRIPGATQRFVYGKNTVLAGSVNEACIGLGQSGRYPLPTAAAQMTIVSDSANDTLGGSGANVVLVRGLATDMTELFEAVLMSGLTPVTTTNLFYRVNSTLVAVAGTSKVNSGIITLKNGADLLQQIGAGDSVSRTCIFSVPIDVTALQVRADILLGKDAAGTAKIHIFEANIPGVDITPLEQDVYQNQVSIAGTLTFPVSGGSDIEVTAYSDDAISESDMVGILQFFEVDNDTI